MLRKTNITFTSIRTAIVLAAQRGRDSNNVFRLHSLAGSVLPVLCIINQPRQMGTADKSGWWRGRDR